MDPKLRVRTHLRYKHVEPDRCRNCAMPLTDETCTNCGTISPPELRRLPPCGDHPGSMALQVTSTTRRWVETDEGRSTRHLSSVIHEHSPVCSVCFEPLLKED